MLFLYREKRGPSPFFLSLDWESPNGVLVGEFAPENRVFELHAEALRGTDAALRRQGAAEHRPSLLQGMPGKEVLRGAHGGHGTLLVELAVGPRTQHQPLPVRLDLVVAPRLAGHGLGAQLLGERHADGLGLAVGVVRAHGDAQPGAVLYQHELHFAARVGPGDLYFIREAEQVGGHAVEDRRGLRRLDADVLELADVLAQRLLVAPGPAGDHQLGYLLHSLSRTSTGRKEARVKRARSSNGTVASMPILATTPARPARTYSWPRAAGTTNTSREASMRVARAYSTSAGSRMSMSSSTAITRSRSFSVANAARMALRSRPSCCGLVLRTLITAMKRCRPPAVISASWMIGTDACSAFSRLASMTYLRSITVSRP